MGLVERVKLKIKEMLKERGWSIYMLANKADLTEACIRNWYTKRNYTPSLEAIEKICRALEISVTELVCDEKEELVPMSDEEKELIKNWLRLDGKEKRLVLMQIDLFING